FNIHSNCFYLFSNQRVGFNVRIHCQLPIPAVLLESAKLQHELLPPPAPPLLAKAIPCIPLPITLEFFQTSPCFSTRKPVFLSLSLFITPEDSTQTPKGKQYCCLSVSPMTRGKQGSCGVIPVPSGS